MPVSAHPGVSAPARDRLPYLNAELGITERVEDLLSRMTLKEKAGLCFHTILLPGAEGTLAEESNPAFHIAPTTELVLDKNINHFNLLGTWGPREIATWHNNLQELAASSRLGIPVTISSDPRHAFTQNPGTGFSAGAFSQWPEATGLAAIGDEDLVRSYADIVRREYLAVGLRLALHPQVDLATEPRWARASGTFGSDADLTSRMVRAYIEGLQGPHLATSSVSTMTKHFPGGGPQKDGEDPHFDYGREQIYPGGMFDYHLKPFEAALEAGASQIMPYYGMPVDTEYEEVGFAFNRAIITGLLRERYGFDGIVCADWGVISPGIAAGAEYPARAWGLEHLSSADLMVRALEAGIDQFGGESCPELLVELFRSGRVPENRLDASVRRLLREKFVLGLFDQRIVDVEAAESLVGSPAAVAAGRYAQSAAMTLLKNAKSPESPPVLPLTSQLKLYIEGIDPAVASEYGLVVEWPEQADVALLRLSTPFEPRTVGLEQFFHAGTLDFEASEIDRLVAIMGTVPTVVDICLDRAAVIPEISEHCGALLADFGASDEAALDVMFGRATPRGRLPFELPRSMEAVLVQRPDVPNDTKDPLYPFGAGLDLPMEGNA